MSDDLAFSRPRWSVSQAAKHAGVARSTIQRYLARGAMPGAYRDDDGVWSIGVDDLLAAGFRVDAPTPPDRPAEGVQHRHAPAPAVDDAEHARRIAELEAELADVRRRAEVAEAVARERSEQISDLRRTVAALEAGRSDRPSAPPPMPASTPVVPSARRGLFGRIIDAVGGQA